MGRDHCSPQMRQVKTKRKLQISRKRKVVNKNPVLYPPNKHPVNTGSVSNVSNIPNVPASNGFIGWTARAFQKPEQESENPQTPKSNSDSDLDGCYCVKCNEFHPYAEPNMDDGTLVCYSCRNPWPS